MKIMLDANTTLFNNKIIKQIRNTGLRLQKVKSIIRDYYMIQDGFLSEIEDFTITEKGNLLIHIQDDIHHEDTTIIIKKEMYNKLKVIK